MDPDYNLIEQREIMERQANYASNMGDFERLLELTRALDEWLSSAGTLPAEWDGD